MDTRGLNMRDVPAFLLAGLVLIGLAATGLHSFLLFHSLAEMFSITVACGIFMVAWNSRRLGTENYFMVLGIAYLFVGIIDLLHTLAYKGMGVFGGYNEDLPIQLWIAARYVESVSLLLAALLVNRRVRANVAFPLYFLAATVLLLSIFWWRVFPRCFDEVTGLTAFKRWSEYAVCLILAGAMAALLRNRHKLSRRVLQLLIVSIVVTIASELAFTRYSDVYSLWAKLGHLLKIVSFYLVYKAVIETTLMQPYDTLFRELKESEEAVRLSQVRFRRIVDEVGDGIVIVNRAGIVRYANPVAARLLGHRLRDVVDSAIGFPTTAGAPAEVRIDRPDESSINVRVRVVETLWEGEPCHLVSMHAVGDPSATS